MSCTDAPAQSLLYFSTQSLKTVEGDAESRAKGFAKGGSYKLLEYDFILATNAEHQEALQRLRS
jgi:hypothetical protein